MRRVLIPAAALLLSGCTGMFLRPSRRVAIRPEDVGAVYKTVSFPSTDGTPLTGMIFPARIKPAKGTVIHFHGNAGNMTSHFGFSFWLVNHGFNVFIFDYRGYGKSGGRASLKGAIKDGIAAVRYIRSRKDLTPERVVVFAQSLGGALALSALARMKDPGVKAVVLDSTFASYSTVAQDKLAHLVITWPLQWPLSRLLFSTRYQPIKHISRLPKVPLAFIHGTADRVISYQESRRLFERANEPKQFWTVRGGRHTDAVFRHAAIYRPKIANFFNQALKQ